MRSAIGKIAGPDSPPRPLRRTVRRRCTSTSIPCTAFTSDSASAPSPSHTRAICAIEVTLGESFTNSGLVVARRQARTSSREHRGVLAELDPARLHVRAARVQLERSDPPLAVEPLTHLGVALELGLEDARDDGHRRRQRRQLLAQERLDPDVLEADRVQHAGRRFRDPRRHVAGARLERERLGDDAAQLGEVDERRELGAVAAGAAREQHRVAQRNSRQLGREVDGGLAHEAAPQPSASDGNTGPCVQT